MKMGVADTSMLKCWITMTSAGCEKWVDRLGDRATLVCPACDSYALGVETNTGLPFYSEAIAAFLTVSDWDWWNRDPRECDIRQWPDFGCLTFSKESLRSTVGYLRENVSDILDPASFLPFVPNLLGPTGIPEDEDSESEWENQLNILHSRMRGEFSKRELDVAVRDLIQILV
jgi:hypothetical protein